MGSAFQAKEALDVKVLAGECVSCVQGTTELPGGPELKKRQDS